MSNHLGDDLKKSIRIEKIISSYSLEGWNPAGVKTSSFLSYTSSCVGGEGWTMEEARYVEACLSQQVVEDLHTDAMIRGQITKDVRKSKVSKMKPMYEALQQHRIKKVGVSESAEDIRDVEDTIDKPSI